MNPIKNLSVTNNQQRVFKKKSHLCIYSILIVVGVLIIVSLNVSATISPDNIELLVIPDECINITKTVYIPSAPPCVDVVFAFDLTGSMGSIIDEAKLKAIDIMNTLISNYPDVTFTFGVMSYMDYVGYYYSCGYPSNPNSRYGRPGDYPYSLNQSLTSNLTDVSTAINGLVLGSGGDGPQDYTRIFFESYADPAVGWRDGAKKLLVNFGDNVPHDCNLNEGVNGTIFTTGKDPGRDTILDTSDDLDLHDVLADMITHGVVLIECHTTTVHNDLWTYWTGLTGGNIHLTSSTTLVNDVVTAITTGLEAPKVYNVHLEVITPGFEDWVSFIPSSFGEVTTGTNVTFDETICVPSDVLPDTYEFIVSVLDENEVNYGDEINSITVINQPPVISDIPDQTINESQSFAIIYLDDFVDDPDQSDDELVWTYTGNSDLNVSINGDREATIGIPDIDWFGSETISFTATDPFGEAVTDPATFTVIPVNDPPVVSDIPDQTILEGNTFVTINLDNYVNDVEDIDKDIKWNISGNLELNVSIDINRSVTITIPYIEWNGAETITFTAMDTGGLTDQDAATYTVSAVNDPPDAPIHPHPLNDTKKTNLSVILIVNVSDIDGDILNVSFYNANDDSLIGYATGTPSGGNASITWVGLNYRTVYSWYAMANDSEYITISETWIFTTKNRPSSGPSNIPPFADGSLSDSFGFVGEALHFDGSKSEDLDGSIVNYTWDFDDGTLGYGKYSDHIYEEGGMYQAILTVFDDFGDSDIDFIDIEILQGNRPPSTPTINGPDTGHQNSSYEFTVVSFDLDNDTIQYVFDWGDGNSTITTFLPNGNATFQTHTWFNYGEYTISVQAFDNETGSGVEEHTIYIDVLPIDDIIKGYLVDEDSEDTYDIFDNSDTENQTAVEVENNTYLIDIDGDGKWDHAFNKNKGVSTYYQYLYDKYYEKFANDTPGFEVLTLFAALALICIITVRRKRRH